MRDVIGGDEAVNMVVVGIHETCRNEVIFHGVPLSLR
jgi:hypothetical protein